MIDICRCPVVSRWHCIHRPYCFTLGQTTSSTTSLYRQRNATWGDLQCSVISINGNWNWNGNYLFSFREI